MGKPTVSQPVPQRGHKKGWWLVLGAAIATIAVGTGIGAVTTRRLFRQLPGSAGGAR